MAKNSVEGYLQWNRVASGLGLWKAPGAREEPNVPGGSFAGLQVYMWDVNLSEDGVRFSRKAGVVKYLVAREYPERGRETVDFGMDGEAVARLGARVFFASCVRIGPRAYRTLGKSRAVALATVADSVEDASGLIDRAIGMHFSGSPERAGFAAMTSHCDHVPPCGGALRAVSSSGPPMISNPASPSRALISSAAKKWTARPLLGPSV